MSLASRPLTSTANWTDVRPAVQGDLVFRRMRRLVLAAVAAAAMTGCNGSDSEGDGADRTTSSSSDGYVRRVDALCKEANPELARIMRALTSTRDAARSGQVGLPQTFDTFAKLLRRAVAVSARLETGLRDVVPTEREQGFHDDLLDSAQKGSANLRRQVRAAEAQDSVRLRDLSIRGSVLNAEAKGLVAGHGGFRYCGRG